jgi:hypothetical protein
MQFSACTLYFPSSMMGNILRIDVKTLGIETGLFYAQFRDAKRISYLQKRKRLNRRFLLTENPFIVVLPARVSIEPASLYGDSDTDSLTGITFPRGRYASLDPRWITDFTGELRRLGVAPLFADLRSCADQPRTAENYFGSALQLAA